MEAYKAQNKYEVYAFSVRNEMLPFIPQTARRILDVPQEILAHY